MRVLVVRSILPAQRVIAAHVLGQLHLDHIGAPVSELVASGRAGAHLRQAYDTKTLGNLCKTQPTAEP